MIHQFEKYKGIHPGAVLERELKKRSLKQRSFALSVGERPQTLNAIIKGKRSMNTHLALKVEQALALEEGALVLLQAFYDIKREKEKQESNKPNLSVLRRSLFWDTDMNSIDWERQFKAVIQRVFERGNEDERKEIIRFYGKEKIESAIKDSLLRRPQTLRK